jgi:hypothetical protein
MVRTNQLPPGRLTLALGIAAIVLAAVVTLGSAAAGDAVARVFQAPGAVLADLLNWVWPGLRRDWQQGLDLTATCNIVVLSLVFFGILRRWVFRKRQG